MNSKLRVSCACQMRVLMRTGLLALASTGLQAQRTAPAAPEPAPRTETAVPDTLPVSSGPASARSPDVLELSPFVITTENDRGYFGANTMSGTRLNSSLEDLGASISVVTKQQLLDTGSVDINDVFKYELNTEGTHQWTDISVDRGNVRDNVSGNPAGANRVRGLTSANVAVNGFGSSLPLDTYNVDAVEISRGPNSNIFGLGNAGGSVNIIRSEANTSNASTSFTTRGDSYGGYRGSFDVNRPLLDGKLAVRVLGLYDEKGYERNPSQDTTRRMTFSLTARPFQNTTLRANFESYRNFNRRPNSITPRDMTTDWIASGSPTWDPITQTAHLADGTSLTYAQISADRTRYYGVDLVNTAFANVPSWYIDEGEVQLYMINRMPNASGTGPTNVSGTPYLLQNGNNYTVNSSRYPLFTPLGITDRSLYDWTSVNLVAPNSQSVKGETSTVQLEQIILRTERQTLAAQATWLKERTSTYDRRFLGVGTNTQVFIDINEKLLDGAPNPYFLRPYVGGSAPRINRGGVESQDYRGVLAYELDLSRESGWLRWLGRNRFTGLAEYQERYGGTLGYVDAISSTNSWLSGPPASRNNNTYRTYARYYIGDAQGQNVDNAPQGIVGSPQTHTLRYYNGVTKQWLEESVDFDEYYNAGRFNRRLLNTYQGSWQSFLLNDRLILTAGVTEDINRSRDGNSAINPTAATNGYYDTSPMSEFGQYDWVPHRGRTTTAGLVVKPLRWLNLTYNQSDSFSPSSQAYDVWGQPLPDPTGETKDYGFQLKLFNDRLIVTAKQYETLARGRGTSDLNTIVQRIVRMDYRSSSGDPGLAEFLRNRLETIHPDWTEDQFDAEVKQLSGIDPAFIRSHINRTHGDNSDSVSRGQEIQIDYNPTRYWTLKSTITRSNPLNGSMSPEAEAYIASRWETWTTIKDPVSGDLWWTNRGDNNTVPFDWFTNNVDANLKLSTALQGKRRTQTREYRVNVVTNYKLAGIADNWLRDLDIGGAVRWESKGSIGYLGGEPSTINNITAIREYDPNKPVWDRDRYYFDFMAGYNLSLGDKVRCRLQLNVYNVFEDGRLQPVAVNPDGQPWAFRIVDPRQFVLTATFRL